MTVRVWQSHPDDWEATCSEHGDIILSPEWLWAMEAAWGHIAMHHPRPPCTHEYGWHPASRPEEHKCLDCGAALPLEAS